MLRCKSIALKRRPIENETCPLCFKPKQVYPEKSITLCVVAMGTLANRFPTRVARYLKSVTMAMAKVIIPGSYPWQDLKLAGSKPGSAISVAKQFLVCILSQFGERNLFQHLFGWSLSGVWCRDAQCPLQCYPSWQARHANFSKECCNVWFLLSWYA